MNNVHSEINIMATARMAGLLYLIIAVVGAFSIGYVPSVVFSFGDAAATAEKIEANMGLFQLGIIADIIVVFCEVILTVILFKLLKPVDETLSLMAAFARMGMVVVMGFNLINYLVPLTLLSGVGYLGVFSADQTASLAMLFLDAHEFGVYIWQIFFSLHLLVIGYLVVKSGFFPKIIGLLMLVGSFGYALQAFEKLTLSDNGIMTFFVVGFLVIVTLGELAFAFWLLIKGVDEERWLKQAK